MNATPMSRVAIGKAGGVEVALPLVSANRHGLIAGATGTGKTITLQTLAEGFAQAGVPVLLADVKGDLAGLARPAVANARVEQRVAALGWTDFRPQAQTVAPWDALGDQGVPLRIAVSELGPLLFARLLGLNEVQSGVLQICFKVADEQGLLLLNLEDLRALLAWVGENARALTLHYGNVSAASIGAIQRRLLVLEEQGAARVFGEPALDVRDLLVQDAQGRGTINILDATALLNRAPDLYACLLFWLLAELFETLPEAGDLPVPKCVMFFDEAHLLFDGAPAPLVDKIEQVVRLIRSKGVGVYFVTQSPLDVPAPVLAQLGLKIQHALRAFTPQEQKSVRRIAEAFRANPDLDVATLVTELGIGEALVSVLDAEGRPSPVAHTLVRPPQSQIGPLAAHERRGLVMGSAWYDKYAEARDRESAYEVLAARAAAAASEPAAPEPARAPARTGANRARASNRQSVGEAMVKSTVRAIGSQLGRQLVRGILGSLLGGRR